MSISFFLQAVVFINGSFRLELVQFIFPSGTQGMAIVSFGFPIQLKSSGAMQTRMNAVEMAEGERFGLFLSPETIA